jgi:aminopeptidase N
MKVLRTPLFVASRALVAAPALISLLEGCQTVAQSGSGASDGRDHSSSSVAGRDPALDVTHYAIDLTINPERRRLDGTCHLTARTGAGELARIALDLVGLEVRDVRDQAGRALHFVQQGDRLSIDLADPLSNEASQTLAITYGGTPITGLWFCGNRPDGSGPTQAYTQGECDDARGWFPCNDHPSDRATSEVRLSLPAGWIATSNGRRLARGQAGERAIEHWVNDFAHPSYLVSFAAGEMVEIESSWDGVPLSFLAEPEYEDWLEPAFAETDEILAFLSEYTGLRYPFPKYSQVCVANFMWGGMENTSATTLSALCLTDERGRRDDSNVELVAHEAAHQWFGDLVTCADWAHVWLNEGLSTYLTLLYREHRDGSDALRTDLRDAQDGYIAEDVGDRREPTVTESWREPEDLFDTRRYGGAAARLHLLRFVVGDRTFQEGLRTYLAENVGRSVTTEDFRRAMEKVSGQDLVWYFDQWFHGRGFPEFEVDWSWDDYRKVVTLDVKQTQSSLDGTPAAFRTPVLVEIRDAAGVSQHRIEIDERRESFELAANQRPFYVQFDQGSWIPKKIVAHKSASEWLAIAADDDDVNGRRDALRELGRLASEARTSAPKTADTYIVEVAAHLERDASPAVRASAARALGVAGGYEAKARLMRAGSSDPEARVRVSALEALTSVGPDAGLAAYARERFDEGFSWGTMGAAALLVATSDPEAAYGWISERMFVDSPHDALAARLCDALGRLPGSSVGEQLQRWALDDSLAPNARAAAVRTLAGRSENRVQTVRVLSQVLEDEDFRLRLAAIDTLSKLGDTEARGVLRSHLARALTASERRAIEANFQGR